MDIGAWRATVHGVAKHIWHDLRDWTDTSFVYCYSLLSVYSFLLVYDVLFQKNFKLEYSEILFSEILFLYLI